MQSFSRKAWRRQLDLFQAPSPRMTWAALPVPVQQEVTQLLARMLRRRLLRSNVIEGRREGTYER